MRQKKGQRYLCCRRWWWRDGNVRCPWTFALLWHSRRGNMIHVVVGKKTMERWKHSARNARKIGAAKDTTVWRLVDPLVQSTEKEREREKITRVSLMFVTTQQHNNKSSRGISLLVSFAVSFSPCHSSGTRRHNTVLRRRRRWRRRRRRRHCSNTVCFYFFLNFF